MGRDGRGGRLRAIHAAACLAVGATVVFAAGAAGTAAVFDGAPPEAPSEESRVVPAMPDLGQMVSFAFDEGYGAFDPEEAPEDFIRECFDPDGLGKFLSSASEGVYGIVSNRGAESLFESCADQLGDRGWVQLASGQSGRATFVKEGGGYHWLFLDVSGDSGGSVAVMTTRGA